MRKYPDRVQFVAAETLHRLREHGKTWVNPFFESRRQAANSYSRERKEEETWSSNQKTLTWAPLFSPT